MCDFVTKEIQCPTCGKKQKKDFWLNIDVSVNPNLKEKVLNGSIFQLECKRCKNSVTMEYNCMYHDMKNKLIICSIFDNSWNECSKELKKYSNLGYKIRLVASNKTLIEKIKIFDNCLRDTIIEYLKTQASELLTDNTNEGYKIAKDMIFLGLTKNKNDNEILEFYYKSKIIQTPKSAHDKLLLTIPEEIVDNSNNIIEIVDIWHIVDWFLIKYDL